MLDEADQLLEMGFRPAIERVLSEWWGVVSLVVQTKLV